jgi:hypothetical protein
MNSEISCNKGLLDHLASGRAWFRARKTGAIAARQLELDQTVETLEGPVMAKAGDWLCRGAAGELWPQSSAELEARYEATEEVGEEGWRKYLPRGDAEGVMAAQVPVPFSVLGKWGQLSGKAGDFVLKNYRDRNVAYPEDVWVVDQSLFRATYEVVGNEG